MAIKLFNQSSGLDEFANAIPAAIEGYYNAQARDLQKKELAAKLFADQERVKREKALDRAKLEVEQGYEIPAGEQDIYGLMNRGMLKRRPGFISPQYMKSLQAQKLQLDIERGPDPYGLKSFQAAKAKKEFEQEEKGQRLPPDKVLLVQQGSQIPNMLMDIQDTIKNKKDKFGPIGGRLSSLNPYDTEAQAIDAQMRAASQAFGRYMEGGVLRKEDEEKYRRMFPNTSDTPAVAKAKEAVVSRMLRQKQKEDLKALKSAGYDVSPFKDLEVSGVPKELEKNSGALSESEKKELEELEKKYGGE